MPSVSIETNGKRISILAENAVQQLGTPRIGIFAEQVKTGALHLEMNSWQHVLDLLYKEALRRGNFEEFITVLKNPPIC